MDIWITSDLHFGHKNAIKHCNRPFETVEDMDEYFIAEINTKVKQKDEVYFLGDFSLRCDKQHHFFKIFDRLPGNWIFILGNHDKSFRKWKKDLLSHERIYDVLDVKYLRYKSDLFILSHFEFKTWDYKNFRNYGSGFKYKGVYHFYGHYHNKYGTCFDRDTADVGIDATNYKMATIEEHVERAKKFEKVIDNKLEGIK